ncbi:MAG: phosphotransferase family protein [Actinomycetota bacterium]|nr:phosphotransferase family protein [Actinomycetota bacterium]
MRDPAVDPGTDQSGGVIDAVELARWIGERTDVVGGLRLARIGLGQSNLTFSVADGAGVRWVARRPPQGELLASAHDVRREGRILAALRDSAVPVPAVLGVCDDPRVTDAPLVVMEHVDGVVVDRMPTAEAIPPDVRAAAGHGVATTLAAVHAVDLDRAGLADLGSHRPYAARQLRRWSRQWEASKLRDLAALDRLTEWLTAHAPERQSVALVHGDFHLRNLVLDPTRGRVRAVLDWELSTLGDPLADLGSVLAYWPEAGEAATGVFAASALPGFPTRRGIVEAYAAASGWSITDLPYWHALGLWKIAIIAEGIRRRAHDVPANAADGGPPDPDVVDRLVERAWGVVGTARTGTPP